MSSDELVKQKLPININTRHLKIKTNEFLSGKRYSTNLLDILRFFEQSIATAGAVTPCLLAIEQIFTELLRRKEMVIDVKPLKPKDHSPDVEYREWLQERYRDAIKLILSCLDCERPVDSTQALVTAMRLLSYEGRNPLQDTSTDLNTFPMGRYRNILIRLLSVERFNTHLFARFKEFSAYLDVIYYTWKLLPGLTPKGAPNNDIFIQNYLELINVTPIPSDIPSDTQLLCLPYNCDDEHSDVTFYDYLGVRKNVNKAWNCAVLWELSDQTHKQLLIVLLERVLQHLDKPVLLTDFLMDSLDVGGPISLLALQGIFTLIQQHNLTYPNVYEKLYSMFEPEIFHTKFKARLFYLADIFLSSSHLPENLVAAFVKRLARLSLVAPPQDIMIIIYFVGNLILRHAGLKRLIYYPQSGQVNHDPYIMDERDPCKSHALDSSLWEFATLQNHAMPTISQAAKLIFKPLPTVEWNLADYLEIKENDIFDQEILKRSKECALNFERSDTMFTAKNDKFLNHWNLF